MPKLNETKCPACRLHKASNQGVATLNNRDIYLGAYDSAESEEKHSRVFAQ